MAISRPPPPEAPSTELAPAVVPLPLSPALLVRRRDACFRSCMMPRPRMSGALGSLVSAAMLLLSSLNAPPVKPSHVSGTA